MKRFSAWLCTSVLVVAGFSAAALPAQAAPPTATWSGTTTADAANVGVTAAGLLNLANVRVADSQVASGSQLTPRSTGKASNLAASVAGIGLGVQSTTATAGPAAGSQTRDGVSLNAAGGLVDLSAITGSAAAAWNGDSSCVTDGVLASSSVDAAKLTVDPSSVLPLLGGLKLLDTGDITSSGSTRLVSNGGNGLNRGVQSTSSGSVAGASILGALTVNVGESSLRTTATGSAGGSAATYTPGVVTVRNGTGPVVTLVPGASATTFNLDLGALTADISVRANSATSNVNGAGTNATASVNVVTVTVSVATDVLVPVNVLTSTINLVPLQATSVAPAGGIDCPAPQPAPPVVSTPADGSRTNDTTPTYSGTGAPGATVNVSIDNGTPVTGAATVTGGGTWSYTPTTPLSPGSHNVRATQTLLGATSAVSNVNTFFVDTTAPAAPVLSQPANGSTTDDTTPTFTGNAEAGSTVRVFVDVTSIGTTTATGGGTFSFTPTTALGQGSHQAFVRATDEAGNTSPDSNTNTFTVDSVAPAAPVVVTPANGSSVADRTPTLAGTAENSSSVEVFVDGASVGTVPASATGAWTLDSPQLSEGSHTVYAVATDAAGNASPRSNTNTFRVDVTAPLAPVIIVPVDGSTIDDPTPDITGTAEPNASVTVRVDGVLIGTVNANGSGAWTIPVTTPLAEGLRTVTAVQTDAAGNASPTATSRFTVDTTAPAAPVILGPAQNSTVRGPSVTVSGTGEAGASLVVSLAPGGLTSAPVTVSPAGTWSVVFPTVADGSYTASATQTDPAGNVSPVSNLRAFVVSSAGPAAPVIDTPPNNTSTDVSVVPIAGTGIEDALVTVTLSNGASYGPVPVVGGRWTVDTASLADGTYTAAAVQDVDGDVSADSNTVTFTVDTVRPAPPVITTPADGSVTGNPRPTVSGTGEAGSTVTVFVDGAPVAVGSAVVDGAGSWALADPLGPLGDGEHTVTASQRDAAGNLSDPTTNTFTVDLLAPADPVILVPVDNSSTNDTTPTISGTGEAGASVTVRIGGTVVGTALVQPDLSWTLDAAPALDPGTYVAVATQTDPSGNVSGSDSVTFTIDTGVPDAPVISEPDDGDLLADRTPTISGTGEAGAAVTVLVGGQTLGPVTVANDGSWSVDVATPLADGPYTATATQTDPAGNVSPADSVDFRVDNTAPAQPVITVPAPNAVLRDATPVISGSAENNSTVTVYVDNVALGTTLASGTGAWSFTPTDDLAEGAHSATATATDAAGNVSAPSVPVPFTIDTLAPTRPVITVPVQDARTSATPTISGTADANTTVEISVDGTSVGTTTATPTGTFSLTLVSPLAGGPHTATAISTDAAGNDSARSTAVDFVVDVTPPAKPVVTTPADGSSTTDQTPQLSGTAEAGSRVEIFVDGVSVGTVTATGGQWTRTSATLAEGEHTVYVTATDSVGNVSVPSDTNTFTVDRTVPEPPVIESPTDGQVLSDPTPTISGSGENGALVTVRIDGAVVGTATVVNGAWSLTLTDPLGDGTYTATATQADPAGNVSGPSIPVDFTVDTGVPRAPVITAPSEGATLAGPDVTVTGTGEVGASVVVTIAGGGSYGPVTVGNDRTWSVVLPGLADGDYTVSAVQTDPAGNASPASDDRSFTVDSTALPAPVITYPTPGTVTGDPTPVITGTGVTGATVAVSVDGQDVGSATVVAGLWSLQLTDALTDGPHTVVATQTGANGIESAESTPVTFTVDLAAPAAPVVLRPADGSSTNDTTPTISGTGEPGASLVVTLDGTELDPVTVLGNGTWSAVSPVLPAGDHTVSAVQTDPYGNESDPSDTNTFTVDLVALAPVVTAPADGSTTSDTTPTIRGTGEPGATVVVSLNGVPLVTDDPVVVAPNGTWSVTVPDPLDPGSYTVTATQTDPAGNISPPSEPVTFDVDDVAPPAPVITSPTDGTVVSPTPTVTGTAEPGASVEVFVDGDSVGTVTADPTTGVWSLPLTDPLAAGEHDITAVATDATGNVSDTSDPVTVLVGAAPVITSPRQDAVVSPTPRISGTGQPGTTLQLVFASDGPAGSGIEAGDELGTVEVGDNGRWSLDVSPALDSGRYEVQALLFRADADPLGSNVRAFQVRNADDPVIPVITTPGAGDTVDSPVQICGTGEPGGQIVARDQDGAVLGTATVTDAGTWCLTADVSDGTYTVTVTQTVGDDVTTSEPVTFSVASAGVGNGGANNGGGNVGGGGSLASTGGPQAAILGAALLLLLGGAGALVLSRRRRT